MPSNLPIREETRKWVESAGMTTRDEHGRFSYAHDFSNTNTHFILELQSDGLVAWRVAQERTYPLRVEWYHGFASLELAEKWVLWKTRSAVRRATLPREAEIIVTAPDYFVDADPRCVFVPARDPEVGPVMQLWCDGSLLMWERYSQGVAAGDLAEASHVLTVPYDDLRASLLDPDGQPLFTTENRPLYDLDAIDWPGKDGDYTSAWSPVHGKLTTKPGAS